MDKTAYYQIIFGIVVVVLFLLALLQGVFATVTVTTATGGSAISADSTGGAYTTLVGPVISEGVTADIGTGTIILNVPSGFIFDIGGTAPTVLVTRIAGTGNNTRNINDLASGSTISVTRTSTTLIITITGATSSGVRNSLTWQDVRVRPTAGTPLASGNITKTGTSVIVGIVNSVTNLGTLTEVVGAKTQLVLTVQPSVTATVSVDFTVKPAVAVRDQFGNTVTSDNSTTITRTAVLSTQTCGGTAGSGTLTSTPVDGATVTAGVVAYTAMQYSAGESIKICMTSSGVTSVLSNEIVVSVVPTPTPTPTETPTPTPTETPTPTPTPIPEPPTIEIVPSGSGGGSSPTKIIFSGEAYPGATLKVDLLDINSYLQEVLRTLVTSKTDDRGRFEIGIEEGSYGKHLYGLSLIDRNNNISAAKVYVYEAKFNTIIRQENIILSPMFDTDKRLLAKSDDVVVSGYGSAENTVQVLGNGKAVATGKVDSSGKYSIKIRAGDLSVGINKIQVRQIDNVIEKQGDLSEIKTVTVGQFSFASVDMNEDKKIDISDWSIFLYSWSAPDNKTRLRDDFNKDGVVDVTDFSVFLTSFQDHL